MYKTSGKTYEKLNEAKAAARADLIGKPEDAICLVFEWQSATPTIGGGFWSPVARAEYKGNKIICV